MRTLKTPIALLLSCIFLFSCAGPKSIETQPGESVQAQKPNTPEEMIAAAMQETSLDARNNLLLSAAQLYWDSNQPAQAKAALLDYIDNGIDTLSRSDYFELMLKISLYEGSPDAERYADLLRLNSFDRQTVEEQRRLIPLIADGYASAGNNIAAALWLIETHTLNEEDASLFVSEQIWRLLRETPKSDITRFEYDGDSYDAEGWLSLAQSIMQNEVTLEQQYRALESWQMAWESHPANLQPPREIELLSELPQTRPKRIALALPLTGKLKAVGTAVRDGFAASHFLAQDDTALHFIDTHQLNAQDLIDSLNPKPDLIIGPLSRTILNELNQSDSLDIPVLALNQLDSTELQRKHTNLFQFSLKPESEASQIASAICSAGFDRIGLIASNQDWGLRMAQAFKASEGLAQCKVTSEIYFGSSSELGDKVSELLGTSESNDRKRKLSLITGESLEFTPRRRADLDALVMFARPEDARQIKPLFAFHYAAKLPVFSSSHAIDHSNNNQDNVDLNGVIYTDMPWSLSNTNPVRQSIADIQPEQIKLYDRFFAFGADAHKLAPRLPLLQNLDGSVIEGHTGRLSMKPDGSISRVLEWASIRSGQSIPAEVIPR